MRGGPGRSDELGAQGRASWRGRLIQEGQEASDSWYLWRVG